MGRAPCCEKMGLKRGAWTREEDQILTDYIHQHGHGNWRALPKQAGTLLYFTLLYFTSKSLLVSGPAGLSCGQCLDKRPDLVTGFLRSMYWKLHLGSNKIPALMLGLDSKIKSAMRIRSIIRISSGFAVIN